MTGNIRKLVFFFVLLAVVYLAYRFMIAPANKRLAEQRVQLQTKMDKLKQLEEATAATVGLSAQLKQLENSVEFFQSKLPPQSHIHKVLQQVAIIAQKQGLKTKMIKALKQTDCMGFIEQPLNMELYGDFRSYYSFLLELEQLPRITKIRQLELIKDPKDDGITTAKFVVSIFFQDQAS